MMSALEVMEDFLQDQSSRGFLSDDEVAYVKHVAKELTPELEAQNLDDESFIREVMAEVKYRWDGHFEKYNI
jgi:anion-transporting  ArsA/GET3 family ATPase